MTLLDLPALTWRMPAGFCATTAQIPRNAVSFSLLSLTRPSTRHQLSMNVSYSVLMWRGQHRHTRPSVMASMRRSLRKVAMSLGRNKVWATKLLKTPNKTHRRSRAASFQCIRFSSLGQARPSSAQGKARFLRLKNRSEARELCD